MTPAASLATKTSRSAGLLVGAFLMVIAMIVAVIAAKPGHEPVAQSAAGSAVAATHPAAALAARETRFDFGQISMAAGNVSHRYWFKNEGEAPVLIQRIYTSCMCTTATLVKGARVIGRFGMAGHGPLPEVNQSLEPGETAYMDVAFDPAAHGPAGLGRTERVVTIEPRTGEPLQLGFTADVRP